MLTTDDWLKIGQGVGALILGILGYIGLRKGGKQEEEKHNDADFTVVQGSIADVRPLKDLAELTKKNHETNLQIHHTLLGIENKMIEVIETLDKLQLIAHEIDNDRKIEAEVQARLRNERIGRPS